VAENEQGIKAAEDKMAATNSAGCTDEAINVRVEDYGQSLESQGIPEDDLAQKKEEYRTMLEALCSNPKLAEQYNKALAEKTALETARPGLVDTLGAAKQAINLPAGAISKIPTSILPQYCNKYIEEGSPPNTEIVTHTFLIDCDGQYQGACENAIRTLTQPYEDIVACPSGASDGFCEEPHHYALWLDYQRKKEFYKEAKKTYCNLPEVSSQPCDGVITGTGVIKIWRDDAAEEVLRRVDKRGVLQ
jgi:hypothetical protein